MIDYGIMHGYVGKSYTLMIYLSPIFFVCGTTLLKIISTLYTKGEKPNGSSAN